MSDNLDEGGEPKSLEVIRIETGSSRIISITQQRIEYLGLAGEPCTIDLEECARNYMRWHSDHSDEFVALSGPAEVDAWNARCVGTRDLCDSPPWVQFMNERRTRFEFDSYEAIYRELLTPLSRYGWQTFDMD